MITLLNVYPEHLNLNGDAGNLVVLQKQLSWCGEASHMISIQPGELPSNRPDFVLIGHGSTAAWKQMYSQFALFTKTLQEWMAKGTQVLAISSGYAALHGLLPGLPSSIERVDRISKFVVTDFEGSEVIGYLNSDLQLPAIERIGNLVGSTLHGPLLAKNPSLVGGILRVLGVHEFQSNQTELITSLEIAARELAKEQSE